jgi:hypothetical protein
LGNEGREGLNDDLKLLDLLSDGLQILFGKPLLHL